MKSLLSEVQVNNLFWYGQCPSCNISYSHRLRLRVACPKWSRLTSPYSMQHHVGRRSVTSSVPSTNVTKSKSKATPPNARCLYSVFSVGTTPLPLSTLQTSCSWFSIIERVSRSGRVFPLSSAFGFVYSLALFSIVCVQIFRSYEISDRNLWLKRRNKKEERELSNRGNISFVCILFRFLRYVVVNVFVEIDKKKTTRK